MKSLKEILYAGKIVLCAGLSSLLMNCNSLPQLHGFLDVAYVPTRRDDKAMTDEVKVSMDLRGEQQLGGDLILYAGGTQTTFANLPKTSDIIRGFGQDNLRTEYTAYGGIKFKRAGLNFYVLHKCAHPVKELEDLFVLKSDGYVVDVYKLGEVYTNEEAFIITNDAELYLVGGDTITEIGVRWEF